jgi:hypothetical protein
MDQPTLRPPPLQPIPQPIPTQISISEIISMRLAFDGMKRQPKAIQDACNHLDAIILNFTQSLTQGPRS